TRSIAIAGVPGLNDTLGRPTIHGTCTTCHSTPGVGNYTSPAPLDVGVGAAARRTPDLPLFTLRCTATGAVVQTTDPARALVTGKCGDVGKVTVPGLRGLPARAPYFHDRSAAPLAADVAFYASRFRLRLTAAQNPH